MVASTDIPCPGNSFAQTPTRDCTLGLNLGQKGWGTQTPLTYDSATAAVTVSSRIILGIRSPPTDSLSPGCRRLWTRTKPVSTQVESTNSSTKKVTPTPIPDNTSTSTIQASSPTPCTGVILPGLVHSTVGGFNGSSVATTVSSNADAE